MRHSVAESESVVVYLYAAVAHHLQRSQHADAAVVHINTQRNGELLARLMSDGCRAVRQTCLLVRGEYAPPHRYVYCPSIQW